MIPKIIHYCWLSGDPIPSNLQKCMNTWEKYLPDYEFILWDLNRFDIEQSLWVKQAFEAKKYAFAADYIRLFAVYTYGGFYLDMDIEVVKSLDSLLSQKYAFAQERPEGGVEAGVFGAEKGFEYIKQCLSYYKDREFILNDGSYDTRPLPSIMYEVMNDNYTIELRKGIEVNSKDNVIEWYSPDYFTCKSYLSGKIKRTKNTYTIHHFAGSWLSKEKQARGKISRTMMRILGEKNYLNLRKLLSHR